MEIHVFGNSFSHGIEIDKEASSLADLHSLYRENPKCHASAWPTLVHLESATRSFNHSIPSAGFLGNITRCLSFHKSHSAHENILYLIDASLQHHLFSEEHGKQKASLFFDTNSIQGRYLNLLGEDLVQFQIWNAAQVLNSVGIHFLFFFAYNPYWFGDKLNEDHSSFKERYDSYAQRFFEHRDPKKDLCLNNQIAETFLTDRPLVTYLAHEELTQFAHPKTAHSHLKLAEIVQTLLRSKLKI